MSRNLIEKLPKHHLVLNPKSYRMAHPVYQLKDIESVKVTHRSPEGLRDRFAFIAVQFARRGFDLFSRYNPE